MFLMDRDEFIKAMRARQERRQIDERIASGVIQHLPNGPDMRPASGRTSRRNPIQDAAQKFTSEIAASLGMTAEGMRGNADSHGVKTKGNRRTGQGVGGRGSGTFFQNDGPPREQKGSLKAE